MQTMMQSLRPEKAIATLLVVLILCLGIAALAFSWLPLNSLQAWLADSAFDGKADFLTMERHQKLVAGSRMMGAALIVIASIFWLLRRHMANLIKELLTGLGEIIHDLLATIREDRKREGVWHLVILAFVICSALGLRLLYVGLPIRYDEATTYMEYASKPIPVLLSYYSSPNNHIFHSLLVHASTWLFGNDVWAIRLPAILAGWLIVPASYLSFRLLYDNRVGLAAAALTAVCPALVEFSVNARGYTLATLFFMILLALMAHLHEKHNPAGWVLVCLFSALGLWTIPVMAFPVAVACAWWLLSPPPGQRFLSWPRVKPLFLAMAIGAFLTAILYIPVVLGSGWEMLWSASGAANRESIHQLMVNALIAPWDLTTRYWPGILAIALGGLALLGFLAHWVIPHRGAWIGFALIAGSYLVLFVFRSNPFVRVWLFATPVILGICAVGLTWLLQRLDFISHSKIAFGAAIVMLICGLGFITALSPGISTSEEGSTLRHGSDIAKRIALQWQSGDTVLTACPVDEPLAYHFKRQGLPVAPVFALLIGGLEHANRIWVVSKHPFGPSLDDLLKFAGPQVKDFAPPVVMERFPQATLFLMQKKR